MSENQSSGGPAPNVIRAACRARLYDNLEVLTTIAQDGDAKDADKIRALDTLGRFGLGAADQAAVHIHAEEGAMVLGVVHLPALEPVEEWPAEDVPAAPRAPTEELQRRVRLLTSGGDGA
ncbi:MAG: hypothetical protein KAJ42_10570 [Gemmatimonadetes bacterium]|nr:hypothetical protein [Gemmatimonadota bacterium]